jgi:hypothetical protein
MPKLYVIMEGLVSIATPPGGTKVLLVKTQPGDRDALDRPLMPHLPRVNFRSGGQIKTQPLQGEDIRFLTGQPAAQPVLELSRLPSLSEILKFAPKTNGHKAAQPSQINTGCVGSTPGTACLVPGKKTPRLAGRVLIDQGMLTSIQVDKNGNPLKMSPTRFKFLFANNTNGPALDMKCDNALLLKIDSGANPIQVQVGQKKALTLSNALQAEKDSAKAMLDDPAEDCVIVRVSDMVDPTMQMKMEDGADIHFPIFFDLLDGYNGPRVIPTLIHDGPGDPPLSRCIPPLI